MINRTLNQSSENNLLKSNTFEVKEEIAKKSNVDTESLVSDWLSPSDTLIGIIKLKPPFTSKIIRAKAHACLLHIGDEILEADYKRFHKQLKASLDENDAAWQEILKHEQYQIKLKVRRCLQLLPEQSSFLLQLEKLVILQLHEINKVPFKVSPILVDTEEIENVFQFPSPKVPSSEPKKPYVIEGDTSIPIQKVYGSRETLPSDVELPFIIVDKDYIYAKCNKFEEIKEFIECQYSKTGSCASRPSVIVEEGYRRLPSPFSSLSWSEPEQVLEISSRSISSSWTELEQECVMTSSSSSASGVTVDSHPPSSSTAPSSSEKSRSDVERSETCPAKTCIEWIKKFSFPYLNTYLDYNEQNYARVQAIVAEKRISKEPELIKASQFAKSNLAFAQTNERNYDIATQYSSQEDLLMASEQVTCPCIERDDNTCSPCNIGEPPSRLIKEVLTRRDQSIYNLMKAHPELLNVFTDEKYDYEFLKL
ncbi:hypothetical protein EVAR_27787_1 [Eumeta japonica]|uniref:Uncharacterized protein n=1 Tax=Eumeta variegata TaxID=151549 RepID=A0A4C1VE08_EUMVA|nr:hypothetical protein EVAR_27787_1 [Eumeta japonica]